MLKAFTRFNFTVLLAGLFLTVGCSGAFAQDMKADEIVAKHLESIGPKAKREEVKTRIARGLSTFRSKLPDNSTAGAAILVTDTNNFFFLSSFKSKDYPFEKIGLFSGKVSIPLIDAGNRSPLGAFINDNKRVIEEGIFGGTLSNLWGMESPKGKISAAGKRKVNGKEAFVVDYFPKGGGSNFTVKLYFDMQTFQHVRTDYRIVIEPRSDKIGVMGVQSGVKITLMEEFGDYKDEAGLMLPHTYRVQYLTDSNSGTFEYNWGFNVTEYFFNQKLEPDFFTFEPKEAKVAS
jgi:hypothetical protein